MSKVRLGKGIRGSRQAQVRLAKGLEGLGRPKVGLGEGLEDLGRPKVGLGAVSTSEWSHLEGLGRPKVGSARDWSVSAGLNLVLSRYSLGRSKFGTL